MNSLQSLNCAQSQVPPSISFQSLSTRPPAYDPGLAVLTLRVCCRGAAGAQVRPAIRVVHGTPDLYAAVERAAVPPNRDDSEATGTFIASDVRQGVDSGVLWTLELPEDLLEPDKRSQLVINLFGELCASGWDISCSASLTHQSNVVQMYELFSWVLKRLAAGPSATPLDCSGILLTSPIGGMGPSQLRILTPARELIELNNLVRNSLVTLRNRAQSTRVTTSSPVRSGVVASNAGDSVEDAAGRKASESGYISEEEKRPDETKKLSEAAGASDVREEIDDNVAVSSENCGEKSATVEPVTPTLGVSARKAAASSQNCDTGEKEASPPVSLREEDCIIIESPDMFKDDVVEASTVTVDNTEYKGDKPAELSELVEQPPVLHLETIHCSPTAGAKSHSKVIEGGDVARTKSLLISLLGAAGGDSSSPPPQLSGVGRGGGHQRESLLLQVPADDPACPSHFELREEEEAPLLLLELAHAMLARQWKLVTTTRFHQSQDALLLFRHDARILPGLGGLQQQQHGLLGVACRQTGLELHNGSSELAAALGGELQQVQPHRLPDGRFTTETGIKGEEAVYSRLIFGLGKHSLTLHATIQLADLDLFVFRQSNLVASQGLSLLLTRGNRILLRGGTQQEVEVINEVLASRWPYPVSVNRRLGQEEIVVQAGHEDDEDQEKHQKVTEDREISNFGNCWEWKVRRYPWKVSYGARLLDRTAEAAGRVLPLPLPNHQDLDSGKSILVFAIKEFSERGWKFCGGVARSNATYLYFLK